MRPLASERTFLALCALLFAATATLTIVECASMSTMGMPMPGDWMMSMMWMRMPGQTWSDAAAAFVAMWTVMMVAMMLPSLVPMLWRYRRAAGGPRLGARTFVVGAGYVAAWTVLGPVAYVVGVTLAELEMRHAELSRAVPLASGVIVVLAGVVQLGAWKAHHLACCRRMPAQRVLRPDAATAIRHGLRLGVHCTYCCAPLTVLLLVLGVMDLRVMAAVTVAITAERLAPTGERVARGIGAVVVVAGLVLIERAV
jgi:predicted metal-binding membrane protein